MNTATPNLIPYMQGVLLLVFVLAVYFLLGLEVKLWHILAYLGIGILILAAYVWLIEKDMNTYSS